MRSFRHLLALLMATLLTACAAQKAFNEGAALYDQGRFEESLAKLAEASRLDPGNPEYRQAHVRRKDMAVQQLLAGGDHARLRGDRDASAGLFNRALAIDPGNARATLALEQLNRDRRALELVRQAEGLLKQGDRDGAWPVAREAAALSPGLPETRALTRQIERERPQETSPALRGVLRKPLTIELRSAPLRAVFDFVSRNAGLNFIFDREVKQDATVTLSMRDAPVERIVRSVLVTHQLEQRILDDRTVLIYPNTPAKAKEFQEYVVRTFYLGNADPKVSLNLLRTVLRARDVFLDERINMLVMRDTPEVVRMAEKILANQDLPEAEVMLDLEILEVGSTALTDLGIRFPDQLSFSLQGTAGAGQVSLPEWLNRDANLVRMSITNPALVVNLRNQAGRTNLLANPKIRVRSREKAKVHIGDKVPVLTTTANATGFIAENVSYIDVGLKLDVEPVVHLEDEVGVRMALEVSSITDQVRSASGGLSYRIGTRNAATTLRLRDGETEVLAGLISDEDRRTASRIPGLGSLPVVGRLFGSHLDQGSKTEIVLLITPRIVRQLPRPELRQLEFSGGTEAAVGPATGPGGGPAPMLFQQSQPSTLPQVSRPAAAGTSGPSPFTPLPGVQQVR